MEYAMKVLERVIEEKLTTMHKLFGGARQMLFS